MVLKWLKYSADQKFNKSITKGMQIVLNKHAYKVNGAQWSELNETGVYINENVELNK